MFLPVNTRIIPGIVPILGLGPNGAIYQISRRIFQNGMARPDYVRLGIVCLSLSHRRNQARDDAQSSALAMSFFHYRGLIIRSLSEAINVGQKRTSILVIAGILTLLIADVSQSSSQGEEEPCDYSNRRRNIQVPARRIIVLAIPPAGSPEDN